MYYIDCTDPDGTVSRYLHPDGTWSFTNDLYMASTFAIHLSTTITNVSFTVMRDNGWLMDTPMGYARKGEWAELINDEGDN